MKLQLIALMFIIGFVLTLHLAMNAQVGEVLKNPRMGNAIFWVIGAVVAVIIGLTGWDSEVFIRLNEVPLWLLTAGAMGAALVFGIVWVIPQIGAGPAFVMMIAAQIITALLFSHFGVLGSPVEPISWVKFVGALFLIGGASMVTFVK